MTNENKTMTIQLPSFPEFKTPDWSELQQTIFREAKKGDSLLINAGPGSGKSTTAREVFHQSEDALMLAFNSSIAEENRAKGCESKTWHSLLFSVLRKHQPKMRVNNYATLNRISSANSFPPFNAPEWIRDAAELSQQLRSGGIIPDSSAKEQISRALQSAELWSEGCEELILRAIKNDLQEHFTSLKNKTCEEIDFADMLWAPVALEYKLPFFPLIILDEAQDTDAYKLSLLQQMTERVIAFGDRNQSIYAFAGALSSAMAEIGNSFSCRELPLNETYRCSQAVTDEVNTIYPGLITRSPEPGAVLPWDGETIPDLILCRNKAPLIKLANDLIRRDIAFRLNKPEWLNKLINYVKGYKTVSELRGREENYLDSSKEFLRDRAETLLFLSKEFSSIRNIINRLIDIKKSTSGALLSTIHSAKGLEAESVLLLHEELIPSRFAAEPEELTQEENLRYVAYSRAKNILYRG